MKKCEMRTKVAAASWPQLFRPHGEEVWQKTEALSTSCLAEVIAGYLQKAFSFGGTLLSVASGKVSTAFNVELHCNSNLFLASAYFLWLTFLFYRKIYGGIDVGIL